MPQTQQNVISGKSNHNLVTSTDTIMGLMICQLMKIGQIFHTVTCEVLSTYFFTESLDSWHTDNWFGGDGVTWIDIDVWCFLLVQ